MQDAGLHPIEWFNFYGSFIKIFDGVRDCHFITDNEAALINPADPNANDLNHTTFKCTGTIVDVIKTNPYNLKPNTTISKFMLLSAVKFKNDHAQAISYIMYELMGCEVPYIRVGVDYFKVIHKETRYGGTHTQIKRWTKDEIKSDHSKTFLNNIPRFDDFTIVPCNKDYQPIIKNCYNLYSEFSHQPYAEPVTLEDIPVTVNFLQHIFGEQFDMGLTYFKVLYEFPKQILPILCLVSAENETGKTTFINFIEMIFGGNYVLISPDDLTKNFNSNYATKNIIAIEETFLEKQMGVEKLKSLSTGKSIQVARKFIEDHPLPFFGKLILNTNKVRDFMKINSREIRFWIREVPQINGKKNTLIEQQLFAEIPKLLRYLQDLPAINFDNGSRMVFTQEELQTQALFDVKEESRSQLYKELEIFITEFFDNNPSVMSFQASVKDIKDKWFAHNNQVSMSYIKKVLQEEAGKMPIRTETGKSIRYYSFSDETNPLSAKVGTPYEFRRIDDVEDADFLQEKTFYGITT